MPRVPFKLRPRDVAHPKRDVCTYVLPRGCSSSRKDEGDRVETAASQALHDSRLAQAIPSPQGQGGASGRWAHSLHPWVGLVLWGEERPRFGCLVLVLPFTGPLDLPSTATCPGEDCFMQNRPLDRLLISSAAKRKGTTSPHCYKMTTVSFRWAGPVCCAHAIPEAMQRRVRPRSPPPPPQGYPQAACMAPGCTFALEG